MVDLVWRKIYELGVEEIDNEHKQLLTLMQEIQAAILRDDLDQCSLLLNELMEVAKEHFHNEEAYLAKVKYPGLVEHAQYHEEMLLKAFRVKQICEGLEGAHDINACFDELVKFLIDDVLMGDLKFKSYLEYEGYINRYH